MHEHENSGSALEPTFPSARAATKAEGQIAPNHGAQSRTVRAGACSTKTISFAMEDHDCAYAPTRPLRRLAASTTLPQIDNAN